MGFLALEIPQPIRFQLLPSLNIIFISAARAQNPKLVCGPICKGKHSNSRHTQSFLIALMHLVFTFYSVLVQILWVTLFFFWPNLKFLKSSSDFCLINALTVFVFMSLDHKRLDR